MIRGTRIKNSVRGGNKSVNISLRRIGSKLGLVVRIRVLLRPRNMFEMRIFFSGVALLTTKLMGSAIWSKGKFVRVRTRLRELVPILVSRSKLASGKVMSLGL